MAFGTTRTRAVDESTSKTTRESPTASEAARDIFIQHALAQARARERTRDSSRGIFPTPTQFLPHDTPVLGNHTIKRHSLLLFLSALQLRTQLFLIAGTFVMGYAAYTTFWQTSPSEEILSNIRKHVVGIADEEPKIYMVTDPQKIDSQGALFRRLVKGDTLLHYQKAALVVLYRTAESKIIGVISTDQEE